MLARLDAVAAETRAVMGKLGAADLEKVHTVRQHTMTARWGILHVIDHTALHLGHMQITYQLWNSGRGTDSPRWFQRLPSTL